MRELLICIAGIVVVSFVALVLLFRRGRHDERVSFSPGVPPLTAEELRELRAELASVGSRNGWRR